LALERLIGGGGMNVEDLGKEELLHVLDRVSNGEKLEDVLTTLIPVKIQVLAYRAHIMLCPHTEHNEEGCTYYIDETNPNKWRLESHSFWADYIQYLMESCKANEENISNAFTWLGDALLNLERYDPITKAVALEIIESFAANRSLPQ